MVDRDTYRTSVHVVIGSDQNAAPLSNRAVPAPSNIKPPVYDQQENHLRPHGTNTRLSPQYVPQDSTAATRKSPTTSDAYRYQNPDGVKPHSTLSGPNDGPSQHRSAESQYPQYKAYQPDNAGTNRPIDPTSRQHGYNQQVGRLFEDQGSVAVSQNPSYAMKPSSYNPSASYSSDKTYSNQPMSQVSSNSDLYKPTPRPYQPPGYVSPEPREGSQYIPDSYQANRDHTNWQQNASQVSQPAFQKNEYGTQRFESDHTRSQAYQQKRPDPPSRSPVESQRSAYDAGNYQRYNQPDASTAQSGYGRPYQSAGFPDYPQQPSYNPSTEYRPQTDSRPLTDTSLPSNIRPPPDTRPPTDTRLPPDNRPLPDNRSQTYYRPREENRPPGDYRPSTDYMPQADYRQPRDYRPETEYRPPDVSRPHVDHRPPENYTPGYRPYTDKPTTDYIPQREYPPQTEYRRHSDNRPPMDSRSDYNLQARYSPHAVSSSYDRPPQTQADHTYRPRESYGDTSYDKPANPASFASYQAKYSPPMGSNSLYQVRDQASHNDPPRKSPSRDTTPTSYGPSSYSSTSNAPVRSRDTRMSSSSSVTSSENEKFSRARLENSNDPRSSQYRPYEQRPEHHQAYDPRGQQSDNVDNQVPQRYQTVSAAPRSQASAPDTRGVTARNVSPRYDPGVDKLTTQRHQTTSAMPGTQPIVSNPRGVNSQRDTSPIYKPSEFQSPEKQRSHDEQMTWQRPTLSRPTDNHNDGRKLDNERSRLTPGSSDFMKPERDTTTSSTAMYDSKGGMLPNGRKSSAGELAREPGIPGTRQRSHSSLESGGNKPMHYGSTVAALKSNWSAQNGSSQQPTPSTDARKGSEDRRQSASSLEGSSKLYDPKSLDPKKTIYECPQRGLSNEYEQISQQSSDTTSNLRKAKSIGDISSRFINGPAARKLNAGAMKTKSKRKLTGIARAAANVNDLRGMFEEGPTNTRNAKDLPKSDSPYAEPPEPTRLGPAWPGQRKPRSQGLQKKYSDKQEEQEASGVSVLHERPTEPSRVSVSLKTPSPPPQPTPHSDSDPNPAPVLSFTQNSNSYISTAYDHSSHPQQEDLYAKSFVTHKDNTTIVPSSNIPSQRIEQPPALDSQEPFIKDRFKDKYVPNVGVTKRDIRLPSDGASPSSITPVPKPAPEEHDKIIPSRDSQEIAKVNLTADLKETATQDSTSTAGISTNTKTPDNPVRQTSSTENFRTPENPGSLRQTSPTEPDVSHFSEVDTGSALTKSYQHADEPKTTEIDRLTRSAPESTGFMSRSRRKHEEELFESLPAGGSNKSSSIGKKISQRLGGLYGDDGDDFFVPKTSQLNPTRERASDGDIWKNGVDHERIEKSDRTRDTTPDDDVCCDVTTEPPALNDPGMTSADPEQPTTVTSDDPPPPTHHIPHTSAVNQLLHDDQEPPFVVDLSPLSLSIVAMDTIKLVATFQGQPEPEVTWLRDRTVLSSESERVSIQTDVGSSILTITNTTSADTACYTLSLSNALGQDSVSASITVLDVPSAPVGQPAVSSISSRGLVLCWSGPCYDGGCPVTGYRVEQSDSSHNTWTTLTDSCKDTSYTVCGLCPGVEYVFRVSACNALGYSQPGLPCLPVLTTDDPGQRNTDCSSPDSLYSPLVLSGPLSPLALRAAREGSVSNSSDSSTTPSQVIDEMPFPPRQVVLKQDTSFEDHYTLGPEIGKGRFGSVFRCTEHSSGQQFAAKFIKSRGSGRSDFQQELSVMNQLHHPKLLMLWDAYQAPRSNVLVMEIVSGGELFERIIDADYILTEREVVHFMRQICDGVGYMHSLDILHLDLKPENILCISPNSNEIKIIDFGLARKFNPNEVFKVMFGTAEFVAPEVINYDQIHYTTDMWSVGVICYILLSGVSPFLADSDAATLANVTRAQWEFDEEVEEEISRDAVDLVTALLHKSPRKRLTASECLSHRWLSQDVKFMRAKRLSTEKHRKFMARSKWQKTSTAIRALGRMTQMQKSLSMDSLSDDGSPRSPSHQRQRSGGQDEMGQRSRMNQMSGGRQESSPRSNHTEVNQRSYDLRKGEPPRSGGEQNLNQRSGGQPDLNQRSGGQQNLNQRSGCQPDLNQRSGGQQDLNQRSGGQQDWNQRSGGQQDLNQRSGGQTNFNQRSGGHQELGQRSQAQQDPSQRSASHQDSSRRVGGRGDLDINENMAKKSPPKFCELMHDVMVREGETARLQVRVSGEPTPTVTWLRGGRVLVEDVDAVMTSTVDGLHTLTITQCALHHDATYECRIQNSVARLSCHADLFVESDTTTPQ